jgi:hypothetical protein
MQCNTIDLDVRRFEALTTFFTSDPVDVFASPRVSWAALVKWFTVVRGVLFEFNYRGWPLLQRLLPVITTDAFLAHPAADVRDDVSSMLTLAASFAWRPARAATTGLPLLRTPVALHPTLNALMEKVASTLEENRLAEAEADKEEKAERAAAKAAADAVTAASAAASAVVAPASKRAKTTAKAVAAAETKQKKADAATEAAAAEQRSRDAARAAARESRLQYTKTGEFCLVSFCLFVWFCFLFFI